jgi:hypothetical protein
MSGLKRPAATPISPKIAKIIPMKPEPIAPAIMNIIIP